MTPRFELMNCLRPNFYYNDKWYPGSTFVTVPDGALLIPCGHCINCLKRQSTEWAYRVMSEYDDVGVGCVLTLTYDEAHYTKDLSKRDFQLFIKRLRRRLEPLTIRYFGCGEYGSRGKRPHYHLILLGYCPDDLKYVKLSKKGVKLYKSDFIHSVWGKGIVSVAEVNFKSVFYSSKYLTKLYFDTFSGLVPPFTLMSKKPGLGYNQAINIINSDKLFDDALYYNGRKIPLPRYYLRVAEAAGKDLTKLKDNRLITSKLLETNKKVDILNNEREQNILDAVLARS